MLGFLILLFALSGIQGKAFPSRYKRSYEASYHYIPYQEGIVRIPAGYSPENFPNYQDYINGYVQPNRHHWPVYYDPSVPFRSMQDPYLNANAHHKIKAQHNWHFIDQNHIPITQYNVGKHQFESGVEVPSGIEALSKKDGIGYEVPVGVEVLAIEDNLNHKGVELPVDVDSLTKKEKVDSYDLYEPSKEKPTKNVHLISSSEFELPGMVDSLSQKTKPGKVKPITSYDEYKLPAIDASGKKEKPIVAKPSDSYYTYKPIKEKPIKEKPIKEKPIKEKPIKEKPIKEKPIKEKPIKEKPIKEKPVEIYDSSDYSLGFNSRIEADNDYETPVVVEALIRKEEPTFQIDGDHEAPVMVEALVRKHPPGYKNEKIKGDIKEKPIKEKPIKEKPIKEKPIKEKPIKEKPIKEKPIKEKPIKEKPVEIYDASDYSLGFNSRIEADNDYETPVVVEALIRKEEPTFQIEGDHEAPVVVEALVRKHPPGYENEKIKGDKIIPKDSLHFGKEHILTENVMNNYGSIVEALSFEQDIESNETPEQEGIIFDETEGFHDLGMDEDVVNVGPAIEASSFEDDIEAFEEDIEGTETPEREGATLDETNSFNEPDTSSFDETADEGSSMDFDGSQFSNNFNPVNSDKFSEVTNIKEQRREFKNCVTLKKETGRCMPFQLCSLSSTASNIDELLRNVCIIDEVFLGVCCPEFPVETVRVDWEQLKPDTDVLNENSSEISKECGKLPLTVEEQDPWPWMALLIARSSDKIFCGGALISEQYVLTAAHCTKRIPRNRILVRLASPDSENDPEQDFEVVEIKRHSGYNPRTMQNDIALLKLSRRVRFGDFRRTVCLAKDEDGIESLVSESASLLRWKETPGEIKDVESLSVISNRDCQNGMRTVIADSIICTEPRTDETMCNADSGAPLIVAKDDRFEVIGILTWNRNDCDERFPTVFTRVASYDRWIEKIAT